MESEVSIPGFSIMDDMDSSSESRKTNITRTRKILLMLLGIMFILSLFYLIFVSFSCVTYTNSWVCERLNHSYEFIWALTSITYDTLWLLVAYRYYSNGLLFFAWFSTIILILFVIVLILSLFKIFQTMMYFHMIANYILIASVSSIMICIGTIILQMVIIYFSFKLSKLITRRKDSIIPK